ncbi:MAG: hypothetical protein HPY84_09905 [Syntrophobacteraceae bacterium]|nr:hypothetical protein [Syntrophobacteraceae bacterium]
MRTRHGTGAWLQAAKPLEAHMARTGKNTVVEEFERRRARMLRSFGACMLLIAFSLCVTQIADSFPGLFGIGRKGWMAFAAAQFAAGVVFALMGFRQYRCPVCHQIPRAHDKYYLGVAVDPEKCPNCGVRLR